MAARGEKGKATLMQSIEEFFSPVLCCGTMPANQNVTRPGGGHNAPKLAMRGVVSISGNRMMSQDASHAKTGVD